jgi:nucleoside-diphosphate-sugar epimerase
MATYSTGRTALVTGGSGYFGLLLVEELLRRGDDVRVFDLHDAGERPAGVELVRGDIRDRAAVSRAVDGADVVFHNVAQVALADPELFTSVNVGGTEVLLDACLEHGVGKVVNTSTSAVYGVPAINPVTEAMTPVPVESYGEAKLAAERACHAAARRGLDVSTIRPATIVGPGRLGIFTLLFDWIAAGADVVVLGRDGGRYQFVHARDLADACLRAGDRPGPETYNIGARDVGTMRSALAGLAAHAGTRSRVRSLPVKPTALAMRLVSQAGLAPFAAYHWHMFGKSIWFDTAKAESELGWHATSSNMDMLIEAFDWYLANQAVVGDEGRSPHRRPVREGALGAARWALSRGH